MVEKRQTISIHALQLHVELAMSGKALPSNNMRGKQIPHIFLVTDSTQGCKVKTSWTFGWIHPAGEPKASLTIPSRITWYLSWKSFEKTETICKMIRKLINAEIAKRMMLMTDLWNALIRSENSDWDSCFLQPLSRLGPQGGYSPQQTHLCSRTPLSCCSTQLWVNRLCLDALVSTCTHKHTHTQI